MQRTWTLLLVPPFLFFLVIVIASIYFGAILGADGSTITAKVTQSTPYLLLAVQILMLLLLTWALQSSRLSWGDIGWRIDDGQIMWREVAIGAVVGLTLAGVYFYALSPLMVAAQRHFGDYVPPGELFTALGVAILPFFLANVVLAPFVEENIYRGLALTSLTPRFGVLAAVFISCFFFGLLHWSGGFWYMLLTGAIAGGSFATLFVWRGNIIAPFTAHLVLNSIEFLYIWLQISR